MQTNGLPVLMTVLLAGMAMAGCATDRSKDLLSSIPAPTARDKQTECPSGTHLTCNSVLGELEDCRCTGPDRSKDYLLNGLFH